MNIFVPHSQCPESKYGLLVESMATTRNAKNVVHSSRLIIEPKTSSISHKHHETEHLLVISGKGYIVRGSERVPLSQSVLVILDPFQDHIIENTEADEDLVIFSFIFEDPTAVNNANFNQMMFPGKKYLITSTPPTPNGDLHLGHISGPYLKADILKRLIEMHGKEAMHQTGQDNHQSYTAYKGLKTNKTPIETANYFGNEIQTTLEMANIDVSFFTKPSTSTNYTEIVHDLFMRLLNNGSIIIKNSPSLFCDDCSIYLYEVYVGGLCPHCNTKTGGNFCENCGQVNDCADLINPTCKMCGTEPKLVDLARAYFPMQPFVEQIINYHRSIDMHPRLMQYCASVLAKPLPDFPVSHVASWGIPCNIDTLKEQIINVWFEMGLGHIASINSFFEENPACIKEPGLEFWSGEDNAVIQCFGFDNSFFNCFLFPSIFLALDAGINPPRYLLENEFYHLENTKFSTSRNHLIWAKDFLKEYTADALRFYLCYTNPENKNTSFSKPEFLEATTQLEKNLRGLLNNLDIILKNRFVNLAPATGLWDANHISFYQKIIKYIQIIQNSYHPSSFSLQSVSKTLLEMLQQTIIFNEGEAYRANIDSQSDEYRTTIALELLMIKVFSFAVYPIMPEMGQKLWLGLGYREPITWEMSPKWIPKGQQVAKLENCCFKVELCLDDVANSKNDIKASACEMG